MPTPTRLTVRLTLGEFEQLIIVGGEVDESNAPDFSRFVSRVLEGTDGDVVVDLANVSYMDSTGLAVLLQARDSLIAAERHLTLRNPSPHVLVLLHVCGLTEHLSIVSEEPAPDARPLPSSAVLKHLATPVGPTDDGAALASD